MELIKIEKSKGGKDVVSARELHHKLCIETQFSIWIQRMFEYGFKENLDYSKMIAENERFNIEYALTLDCAKHIAMLQRTELGMQYRQYLIDYEKKQNQLSLPKTYKEAILELGASLEREEQKDALLLEQAPKVEFFDHVTQSKDELSIGDASKVLNLGYGSITLFKKLRGLNVLMHDNNPYQKYVDNGWFRIVERKYPKKDGTWGIGLKTVVFQKGLDSIRKLLSK